MRYWFVLGRDDALLTIIMSTDRADAITRVWSTYGLQPPPFRLKAVSAAEFKAKDRELTAAAMTRDGLDRASIDHYLSITVRTAVERPIPSGTATA